MLKYFLWYLNTIYRCSWDVNYSKPEYSSLNISQAYLFTTKVKKTKNCKNYE